MNILEFMSHSPFLSAFIVFCVLIWLEGVIPVIFKSKSNKEDKK